MAARRWRRCLPSPPDAGEDLGFHPETLVFDSVNAISQGGRIGLPVFFHEGPLGRADVFDAHPWAHAPGQTTAVVAQKRAGLSGFGGCLPGREKFVEQVHRQKIPEVEPHRICDAAGLGAKAAGTPAQGFHGVDQFVDSITDRSSPGHGFSQQRSMTIQQPLQGAIGLLPLPAAGRIAGFWPETRKTISLSIVRHGGQP